MLWRELVTMVLNTAVVLMVKEFGASGLPVFFDVCRKMEAG
jgi:hypothetical protein